MERMVYEAPDGRLLFDPTPERMASIIRDADERYWQQVGNGEAAIRVVKRHGDGRAVSHAVIQPDGTKVEYAAGQPELWIKQPQPGRFFFTWDCPAAASVEPARNGDGMGTWCVSPIRWRLFIV